MVFFHHCLNLKQFYSFLQSKTLRLSLLNLCSDFTINLLFIMKSLWFSVSIRFFISILFFSRLFILLLSWDAFKQFFIIFKIKFSFYYTLFVPFAFYHHCYHLLNSITFPPNSSFIKLTTFFVLFLMKEIFLTYHLKYQTFFQHILQRLHIYLWFLHGQWNY